jgi:hypothetical protein
MEICVAIARKLIEMAEDGDLQAIKEIGDRLGGKCAQTIERGDVSVEERTKTWDQQRSSAMTFPSFGKTEALPSHGSLEFRNAAKRALIASRSAVSGFAAYAFGVITSARRRRRALRDKELPRTPVRNPKLTREKHCIHM